MTFTRKTQVGAIVLLAALSKTGYAACVLVPTAGDDNFVCDSGTATSLTDLSGNNTLTLPAGSTATITGAVSFGAGVDRVEINAGTIGGAVEQGAGIDTFVMNGGQIQSLAQGDGRDIFIMTGGTIVGAFEDGDVATMTGGTIGRVDMKLDNNIFDMSGGRINGNLVTGLGRDTIIISGGSIGGNVSTSAGVDTLTLTGGEIGGQVLLSTGNDVLTWNGGGVIKGLVSMGNDDDVVNLINLTDGILAQTPLINGNTGNDTLIFNNTQASTGARYTTFENVQLTNGSVFTLNDTFTLGDTGTGTGALSLDASSTLASSSGVISPFNSGQNVNVTNAGLIDLASSGATATDTLTVVGNYTGNAGRLNLQSVLAGDGAASDRLIVSQGTLSGTTTLAVTNLGGLGALTTQNGIEVVEANQGATSSNSAFSLGSNLSAGAYQYYLFKGGVTAGSENSWYLRSSVVAVPVEQPTTPTTPTSPATPVAPAASAPVAAPGTPALPVAAPGQSIALYRLEVPVYAAAPAVAALLGQTVLGTFHQRDSERPAGNGAVPGGWARTFGSNVRQAWSGAVSPSFDGSVSGYQVGHDLYASDLGEGYRQRSGVFASHARASGDVKGFALGFEGTDSGNISLNGDSLGAYWTLFTPTDAYVDAVAMYTRYDGHSRSNRGWQVDLDGHGTTLSLEAGYPIAVSERWVIEPQAQIVMQKITLDSDNDPVSRVGFDSQPWWRGRVGARLKGNYQLAGLPLEPYLRANVWQTFSGRDTLTFDGTDALKTDHRASTADLGAGVALQVSRDVSVYSSVDYSNNLDSRQEQALQGTLGLRIMW
ncbi:MAG: autotransporter outer membrane beta-barrel domain-containing protein [Pseudomonas sp.]|uniref:autotransporter family protein n=1 Tax=Pseudomonas abieticivorans TaxID=2931382 RepID=UPI0020BF82E3|nr:autotransporter outer membrane beta-barrel domain-containing protein [Pseudomonas sp. PIA16]MDE1166543.1 autotransporter outer membrane beta-barrel domain-containing protein [Pseudomonas sp.]